jgi:porin-like protein
MTRTKSFFVGCAAAFITLGVAQAADLPVKAKPVQYVKVCSMYGAGFYYIPGTDTCIRVGSYVRSQLEWGSVNGVSPGTNGPFGFATAPTSGALGTITNGQFDRASNNFNMTNRGVLSADVRSQTEFGTVRGYIALGGQSISNGTTTPTFFFERAFIQFAGFTFGRTQSFFDIFTTTERYSYNESKTSGDTYNYGVDLVGYTAQFGNGFSASISAESPHYLTTSAVVDGSSAAFFAGGTTLDNAGHNAPDIVGQLRIDQNWGYLGISGAAHQVSGRYFLNPGTPATGHPEDKTGWAAQIGGQLNLPWADTVGAGFTWTKGAVGYATKAGSWQIINGSSAGVGWLTDGVFDGPTPLSTANTEIHLTNAWSVNAAYEHFWSPRWRTSLYGGYTKVWYDGTITNDINTHLGGAAGTQHCGVLVANAVFPPITTTTGSSSDNSCSPDFSFWQVGSRTQWNVTKDFYMGVDVTYTHLNTAYKGVGLYSGTSRTTTSLDDQNTWSGVFRTQYSFAPGNEGSSFTMGR